MTSISNSTIDDLDLSYYNTKVNPHVNTGVIFCWCAPRSLSTAFEKYMSQHVDKVYHEPFAQVSYFQRGLIDACPWNSFEDVAQDILNAAKNKTVFVKELAYALFRFTDNDPTPIHEKKALSQLFSKSRHTFLIRDPNESIPSLVFQMRRAHGQNVEFERIVQCAGVAELALWYQHVKQHYDPDPNVLHASDLVQDDETRHKVLHDYLRHANVRTIESTPTWQQGAMPNWQVWSERGWHDVAQASTSFEKRLWRQHQYATIKEESDVKALIGALGPYYEYMKKSKTKL